MGGDFNFGMHSDTVLDLCVGLGPDLVFVWSACTFQCVIRIFCWFRSYDLGFVFACCSLFQAWYGIIYGFILRVDVQVFVMLLLDLDFDLGSDVVICMLTWLGVWTLLRMDSDFGQDLDLHKHLDLDLHLHVDLFGDFHLHLDLYRQSLVQPERALNMKQDVFGRRRRQPGGASTAHRHYICSCCHGQSLRWAQHSPQAFTSPLHSTSLLPWTKPLFALARHSQTIRRVCSLNNFMTLHQYS